MLNHRFVSIRNLKLQQEQSHTYTETINAKIMTLQVTEPVSWKLHQSGTTLG